VAKETIEKTGAFTYRSNSYFEKLPSCALKIEDLKRLLEILDDSVKEAGELEVSTLKKSLGQTQEDFEALKEYVRSIYVVSVVIIGSRGEYIQTDSSNSFNTGKLPQSISKVIFDTSLKFKALTQDRWPVNRIKTQLDFRKTRIWDFSTPPSSETINESFVDSSGKNATWVRGTSQKVMDVLRAKKTNRGWLHKHGIYNIVVWFFIMPFVIWNAHKLESHFHDYFKAHMILTVSLYLYFVFLVCNIFMVFFNYARWIFPYAELENYSASKYKVHRYILSVIGLTVLGSIIYDVFKILL